MSETMRKSVIGKQRFVENKISEFYFFTASFFMMSMVGSLLIILSLALHFGMDCRYKFEGKFKLFKFSPGSLLLFFYRNIFVESLHVDF